jgi:hypothetical protein
MRGFLLFSWAKGTVDTDCKNQSFEVTFRRNNFLFFKAGIIFLISSK